MGAGINSSINYQSTKKIKGDFTFFAVFNGGTWMCRGNSDTSEFPYYFSRVDKAENRVTTKRFFRQHPPPLEFGPGSDWLSTLEYSY